MTFRIVFFLICWILAQAGAAAEVHRFKPTQGHQTCAVREPVLRVSPGDTIETSTLYSDFFTESARPLIDAFRIAHVDN